MISQNYIFVNDNCRFLSGCISRGNGEEESDYGVCGCSIVSDISIVGILIDKVERSEKEKKKTMLNVRLGELRSSQVHATLRTHTLGPMGELERPRNVLRPQRKSIRLTPFLC